MNNPFKEKIKTLKSWIDANEVILETKKRKNGEDIVERERLNFSVQSLTMSALEEMKAFTNYTLPESYYYFLQEIGTGSFFFSDYIGGFELYNLTQLQEYNALFQQEMEEPIEENFIIIGAHLAMGDWMGFCITKHDDRNFDVYSHDYPIAEYRATSDELKSWRTFEEWIIIGIETKGKETL